jgi:serine phosphatase RsbU (regulator of sigma subunit)/pSer/pThr/pTyr-binding forkhead associated (FHA) protein
MSEAPHWSLEVLAGPALAGTRVTLAGSVAVGRAPDNDLVLPDRAVSRQHALIEARPDGSLWLTDLGSRGGTLRNRRALSPRHPVRLEAGDLIAIGPWRFLLESSAAAARALTVDSVGEGETVLAPASGSGALAEQRLRLLLEFAARQAQAEDPAALLALLCEFALAGSGYRRSLVVARPEGAAPRVLCQRPVPEAEASPVRLSASLLEAAAGRDIAVLEAPSQQRLKQSLLDADLRRALCVGLGGEHEPPLFLYLDSDFMQAAGHEDAPALCHALARLAGQSLDALEQRASEQRRLALEAELEIAREIQARIAPASHGVHGELGYAVLMQPGGAVAGDLADVFELPDGSLAVLLGDVSGTGLGAGLMMASVQAFLRAAMDFDADPAAVLTRLNTHLLRQSSGGRFVTLWLGVFDREGRGHYVDAGHGHALRLGEAATPLRSQGGVPLGVVAEPGYRSEAIALAPGEGLLLYSDGVVEQDDADDRPLGTDGLHVALDLAQPPVPMLLNIVAAIDRHRGEAPVEDDITLLVIRRQGR